MREEGRGGDAYQGGSGDLPGNQAGRGAGDRAPTATGRASGVAKNFGAVGDDGAGAPQGLVERLVLSAFRVSDVRPALHVTHSFQAY